MTDDIRQKIIDYLAAHGFLRLGTVGPNGTPQVHTMGYISDGAVVYFSTDRRTRKVRNMEANPAVAYTVDENYTDMLRIQGVQMEGTARQLTEPDEIQRVMDMFLAKYPGMKEMPPEFQMVTYEVRPRVAYFLDNTVAFGHRDRVEFED
jgi:nitroimidazol reductase NimA-like FMN-containing flavoprotein (pyridoxamine 5'-phosphate oxidase superfamily)